MNEREFSPGDTVYVAYFRINEDEVDDQIIRAAFRCVSGHRTTKPVFVLDRGDGRSLNAYAEDVFATELEAVDRLLARMHEHSKAMAVAIMRTLDRRHQLAAIEETDHE